MERILILITSLDRGGAETMIMNYYRHMDRSQVQFDFLVNRPEEGAYEKEIRELGGRIYRMGPMYPLQFAKYKKDFRNFLRQHPEYRIIHSHLEERSYFPLRIAREEGVPIRIAHAHNEYTGFDTKTLFRDYFRFRLRPYPTHRFTCSDNAARWLYGERTVRNGDVQIVTNAIDGDVYAYSADIRARIRAQLMLSDDTLLIGNVGRLAPQKNQMFLLEVLHEVLSRGVNAKLVVVGEGNLHDELTREAKKLGLADSLILAGSVPNVSDYLQAMDVFAFPSLYEGLGMALIEAQAVGLPAIAADTVPVAANISNTVQYLPLDDSTAWAEIIADIPIGLRDDINKDLLISHNYEIKNEAKKLQNFYLNSIKSIS
ncbi:glycosyltransferase family 1 protein [Bifidobacterium pseudolongum]|jgi:glycosyltransferase involved in cell wall biosynthesis|nr:glycosyltransferase family 1 protein [Bifidobacterium pseudolongum]